MGDYLVHHVRFFEYTPLAIQCMAYNDKHQRLALSRSDGSIELWSIKDVWFQEEIIPGGEGNSVEALVWQGSRLFAAGLDGNISEIDLVRLQVKATCPSNAGPVWCLTSNKPETHLAAGTENGCVVLFDTEGNVLQYLKRFDTQESRILCIAWHQTEDVIVTGGIDNIRMWSVHSGRALQRLTLGRQSKNKETVVWCIAVLNDMTIVSGDSRGKVCFWNGRQGTNIKTMTSHKADVYCLAVDPSELSVVASGVDSTVMRFSYIPARENSDWKDWVSSFIHHQHSHDVRAATIIGDTVVTGGVDTNLIQFDMKKTTSEAKHNRVWRKIRPIPHRSLVKMAQSVNVILLQYPSYLEIWRLGSTDKQDGMNGDILPLSSSPIKLIQMKTKGNSVCCDISHDATLIAYSDLDTVRLYQVSIDKLESIQPLLSMKKVAASQTSPPDGAHCMCFTSDNNRLITVTSSSQLQICSVNDGEIAEEFTFPEKSDCVHVLAVSPDNNTAAMADHRGNVYLYNLQTKQFRCSVPKYTSQVTALSFCPESLKLAMAYANQRIYEFDLLTEEYTDWSKTNCKNFPQPWLRRISKIMRIVYNQSNKNQLVLHDDQMFCILDKSQPFPAPGLNSWQNLCSPSKNEPRAFHIVTKYKHLLYLDILANKWIVAVERPPLDMLSGLPSVLKKKKFGT